MIILPESMLEQIKKDAEGRYPIECCGILLGRRLGSGERLVERVCAMENRALDGQERSFLLDPLALFRVEQRAADSHMEIVGFYHSHPDCEAVASAEDERNALPDCSYLIVSVLCGNVCDVLSWEPGTGNREEGLCQETIQFQKRGEKVYGSDSFDIGDSSLLCRAKAGTGVGGKHRAGSSGRIDG